MKTWLMIGFVGQTMFFMRFLIQWIASEKRGESVVPVLFWYFSLAGGLVLLFYAIHIRDPIFILGQTAGAFIYTRNLMLIFRKQKQDHATGVVVASHRIP